MMGEACLLCGSAVNSCPTVHIARLVSLQCSCVSGHRWTPRQTWFSVYSSRPPSFTAAVKSQLQPSVRRMLVTFLTLCRQCLGSCFTNSASSIDLLQLPRKHLRPYITLALSHKHTLHMSFITHKSSSAPAPPRSYART
jgi:hypothetical protein